MNLVELLPVTILAVASFWLRNPAILMITGAVAVFTGFSYYDNYVTNTGLTMGLCFMVFGLVCWGYAFREIFWKRE